MSVSNVITVPVRLKAVGADRLCLPYLRFVQYPARNVVWCTRSFHDWFDRFVKTGKVTVDKPSGVSVFPSMWALDVYNLTPGAEVRVRYNFPGTVKVVSIVWAQENWASDVVLGLRVYKDDNNFFVVRLENDGNTQHIRVIKVVNGSASTIKDVTFNFGPGYYQPLALWLEAANTPGHPNGYHHLDGYENHYPDAPSIWELAAKHLSYGDVDSSLDGFTAVEWFVRNNGNNTYTIGDVIQISPLTPMPFYLGYEESIDYV